MRQPPLIVIGTSAGGVTALQKFVSQLPADFPAPVLIVLHIGMHRSYLPDLLTSKGPLPAFHAVDGDSIVPGRILVAPPGRHLLVEGLRVRLNHGPKEHHARPAIDPLFRSAALSHGPGVIGVVLTGMLDDGTSGLQAIKNAGGIAVVQDPGDSYAPSMPLSALRYVKVDHCLPLDSIPALLVRLVAARQATSSGYVVDAATQHEQAVFLSEGDPMEHLDALGAPSTFACPDCNGVLWEVSDAQPRRFRCHTGHAFTLRSLQYAQALAADEVLWSALRALQEKQKLIEQVAQQSHDDGEEDEAARLRTDGRALERVANELRRLIEAELKSLV